MQNKYRFPDKEGRITIPADIRKRLGITGESIFGFEKQDNGLLLIRQQRIGTNTDETVVEKELSLLEVINSLSPSEQRAAFKYLARRLAESEET